MATLEPMISTRFRAIAASLVPAWFLILHLHWVHPSKPLPWTWMFAEFLPTWAVIAVNAGFYASLIWMVIRFLWSPASTAEKAWWVCLLGDVVLIPVGKLFPRLDPIVEPLRTCLVFASLLSALAILVTLSNPREVKDLSPKDNL